MGERLSKEDMEEIEESEAAREGKRKDDRGEKQRGGGGGRKWERDKWKLERRGKQPLHEA